MENVNFTFSPSEDETKSLFFMMQYLTKQELVKLKKELDERVHVLRKEIAGRIQAAKEQGDLSENAEYVSAKEEQGLNEMRVHELEILVRSVQVVEEKHDGKIGVGNKVKVKIGVKTEAFTIVSPEGVDLLKGKISYESPLGHALMGRKAGDEITIHAPMGAIKYKIIKVD
jgi:transcription elongation factor GreA